MEISIFPKQNWLIISAPKSPSLGNYEDIEIVISETGWVGDAKVKGGDGCGMRDRIFRIFNFVGFVEEGWMIHRLIDSPSRVYRCLQLFSDHR